MSAAFFENLIVFEEYAEYSAELMDTSFEVEELSELEDLND